MRRENLDTEPRREKTVGTSEQDGHLSPGEMLDPGSPHPRSRHSSAGASDAGPHSRTGRKQFSVG